MHVRGLTASFVLEILWFGVFMFKLLMHFELILVCDVRLWSSIILFACVQFSNTIY